MRAARFVAFPRSLAISYVPRLDLLAPLWRRYARDDDKPQRTNGASPMGAGHEEGDAAGLAAARERVSSLIESKPPPRDNFERRNGLLLACRVIARPKLLSVFLVSFALTMAALPAFANVLILVDKTTQQMRVSVDGVPRYQFRVSTGRPGYGTPNGTFHPQRLAATWFSKLYYNSPMPYSIFFHSGYAIHGSYEISRLGGPASHGCIRLHPANAETLFAVVKSEGMAATTIVISGGSSALARHRAPPAQSYGGWSSPGYDSRYTPDYDPSRYYRWQ
jgi:hypothetical protein